MHSDEVETYELWERVYLPGYEHLELRGLGLTEATVGEINSFLIKIPTEEFIKMTIIKPREGANNIFYEVIPGVGFRGDYVVHTSGDYFIKIIIGNHQMPTIKVHAHDTDDYAATIKDSLNSLLQRKQDFSRRHYQFLKNNYGLPDVDIQRIGEIFGENVKQQYAIIEESMRVAVANIRKSMLHFTHFPDCFPIKFQNTTQENVRFAQQIPGSHRSTGGSVFYSRTPAEPREDLTSTKYSAHSKTSSKSSESRKRKTNEKNENDFSKRIRNSSSDENETEASIEIIRQESENNPSENDFLTEIVEDIEIDNSQDTSKETETSDQLVEDQNQIANVYNLNERSDDIENEKNQVDEENKNKEVEQNEANEVEEESNEIESHAGEDESILAEAEAEADAEAESDGAEESDDDEESEEDEEYNQFIAEMNKSREGRRLLGSHTTKTLKNVFKIRKEGNNRRTKNQKYNLRKRP